MGESHHLEDGSTADGLTPSSSLCSPSASWILQESTTPPSPAAPAPANPTIVPYGTIGAEWQTIASKPKPRSGSHSDPYHGRQQEPREMREPAKETFNIMVVGESGLGKTTLLESFFRSFRDEEATSLLFERKETEGVIRCRKQLETLMANLNTTERAMKVAAEKMDYAAASRHRQEIQQLNVRTRELSDTLKQLTESDERKRRELHNLRAAMRSLKVEMKRAADNLQYCDATTAQQQAALLETECRALQTELAQTRQAEEGDDGEEESAEYEGTPKGCITERTVKIKPFDPFKIMVGRHELEVTLIDTPGYGDAVNTQESFDVICQYVEKLNEQHRQQQYGETPGDLSKVQHEDKLVHCCWYFIAPHRLKHVDIAFLRKLHTLVNVVPVIAKSDTMTTKEKEEFKMLVTDQLAREGIMLYDFDKEHIQSMECQDKVEYKAPWAVVGSTDAHIDAGQTFWVRRYPWGDAYSSDPTHSDLPALRNLMMWSGEWFTMKQRSRLKFEGWREKKQKQPSLSAVAARPTQALLGRLRGLQWAQQLTWLLLLLAVVFCCWLVMHMQGQATALEQLQQRVGQITQPGATRQAINKVAQSTSGAFQALSGHVGNWLSKFNNSSVTDTPEL